MTISAPITGASSTSAKFATGGVLGGLGSVLLAALQNKHGITTDIEVISGNLVALFSILGKFVHDVQVRGFHYDALKASLTQAAPIVKAEVAAVEVGVADVKDATK